MERISLTPGDAGFDAVAVAVRCLRQGGVIAAPTETVYGLMTLWENSSGREQIFRLKDRPRDKRLQMLADSLGMAVRHGVVRDERLARIAARFWPGPLTLVCQAEAGETVGLRIPAHDVMLQILSQLGEPLAATSANRSGKPAAVTADDAVAALCGEPGLLLDGGPVDGEASTVASLAGRDLQILRPGPVSEADLRAALAE